MSSGFFMIGFTGLMLVMPDRKGLDLVCACCVRKCCRVEEGRVMEGLKVAVGAKYSFEVLE